MARLTALHIRLTWIKSNHTPNVGDYTSGFNDAIANSGVGDSIGNIDDNTGKIKDSLDVTEEDLKYLRDIAEQESINRFTTAEVTINQTNNNNVSSDTDLDGFTKKRDVYITQDSSNINKWGILQYFDTLQKGENGQAKADALLKLYNKKTRNLKITNALGDNRVRAGSMVVINLDLGDMKVKNWMLVEKCKHTYKEGEHWMDLTLRGGEFIA